MFCNFHFELCLCIFWFFLNQIVLKSKIKNIKNLSIWLHFVPPQMRYYSIPYNQCLSPLMLWVGISIRARCTTLCDKFVSDLRQVSGFLRVLRFSPGTPVSSTNKTDCHDITEILLKVALNTINQPKPTLSYLFDYILYHLKWGTTRYLML